jgi:hypothetical protein
MLLGLRFQVNYLVGGLGSRQKASVVGLGEAAGDEGISLQVRFKVL